MNTTSKVREPFTFSPRSIPRANWQFRAEKKSGFR
jgi:hypothetical protein